MPISYNCLGTALTGTHFKVLTKGMVPKFPVSPAKMIYVIENKGSYAVIYFSPWQNITTNVIFLYLMI
jgi:hypothetical protein